MDIEIIHCLIDIPESHHHCREALVSVFDHLCYINQVELHDLKLDQSFYYYMYSETCLNQNGFVTTFCFSDRLVFRAVPFKSTWEGGGDTFFFIFLLVVGVKPYFFLCWVGFFLLVGAGVEISGVPHSQIYLNGTALSLYRLNLQRFPPFGLYLNFKVFAFNFI